jgi:hypothetical protein
LAKTHSSLTFDELCEEAFGDGLHPWEFWQYDLTEYLQRRRGLYNRRKVAFQEQLTAAMVPYMDKSNRVKIVKEAFRQEGEKQLSLKEQYNKIRKRFEDACVEEVTLKVKNGSK